MATIISWQFFTQWIQCAAKQLISKRTAFVVYEICIVTIFVKSIRLTKCSGQYSPFLTINLYWNWTVDRKLHQNRTRKMAPYNNSTRSLLQFYKVTYESTHKQNFAPTAFFKVAVAICLPQTIKCSIHVLWLFDINDHCTLFNSAQIRTSSTTSTPTPSSCLQSSAYLQVQRLIFWGLQVSIYPHRITA